MTNTILKILILASFLGVLFSCLATAKSHPKASVIADTDNVEIQFVPTHSLYQKRCLVDGELMYCADTGSLATVTVDTEEIEIDFVADAN